MLSPLTFLGPFQLYSNRKGNLDEIRKSLETIITSMNFGEAYAKVYMEGKGEKLEIHMDERTAEWRKKVDEALPRLYAAILVFSVKIQMYFERENGGYICKYFGSEALVYGLTCCSKSWKCCKVV